MMDDKVKRLSQSELTPDRNDRGRHRGALAQPYDEGETAASGRFRVPVSLLSLLSGMVIWELLGRWAGTQFLPPFSQVLLA